MSMKRTLVLSLCALVCCWGFLKSSAQSASQTDSKMIGPIQLEELAKNMKPDNHAMVSAVVDQILQDAGWPRKMDAGRVKQRIVAAELAFQNGQQKHVHERNVLKAVNLVVTKLKAPEYAKADDFDLRKLRVRLLVSSPSLMGRYERGTETALRSELTPLEAFYTAVMLARQKVYNPEFQVTPMERIAQWADTHRKDRPNAKYAVNDKRSKELLDTIGKNIAATNLADLEQLADEFVTTLGVEH